MSDQVIIRVATKIVVPTLLLFGLYVQFHGDYGPGGGFQAGVILSTGFILYGLVFGLRRSHQVLPTPVTRACASMGVLLFGGVGLASLFRGGRFLDYDFLARDPLHGHHGQHLGVLLVELGVMITVFGVMVTIFYFFAARGRANL